MPGGKNPSDLIFHRKYSKMRLEFMKSLYKFQNKHLKSDLMYKGQKFFIFRNTKNLSLWI